MEVFVPVQNFSSSAMSTISRKSFSEELRLLGYGDSKVSVKPRKSFGFLKSGFSDNDHLQYYESIRCSGKKEMGKDSKKLTMKKKLKLLKGMSRNFSRLSEMGFVEIGDGSIGNDNGKMISEAAKVIMAQLQQLRTEEKEMKRKRKEEKAKMKASSRMKCKRTDSESSSSSSSSESSDNDCDKVVNMKILRNSSLAESKEASTNSPSKCKEVDDMSSHPRSPVLAEPSLAFPSLSAIEQNMLNQDCCSNNGSISSDVGGGSNEVIGERIDVCMGGKCKKMGAGALLEELDRRIGVEGAVVGCKCMGRCKNAPNVRILNRCNHAAEGVDNSVRVPTNPLLYIGVGLEDVSAIVAKFFRKEKDLGLMAT